MVSSIIIMTIAIAINVHISFGISTDMSGSISTINIIISGGVVSLWVIDTRLFCDLDIIMLTLHQTFRKCEQMHWLTSVDTAI